MGMEILKNKKKVFVWSRAKESVYVKERRVASQCSRLTHNFTFYILTDKNATNSPVKAIVCQTEPRGMITVK